MELYAHHATAMRRCKRRALLVSGRAHAGLVLIHETRLSALSHYPTHVTVNQELIPVRASYP
jgi:hypothetical protein